MPCVFLIQYCFMTIGVKIGNKFGARITSIIGVLLMFISYGIMIIYDKYFLILVAMGIFGMGDGIANLSVIKNCWKYFPKNTALINGIIIGGLGLSSAVLTPIADYIIINPDEVNTDQSGIYPEEVANNVLDYLKFLGILFLVLGIFAISLTIPYEKEPTSADSIFGKAVELEEGGRKDSVVAIKTENDCILLCEAFFSCKNFMLLIFCFCGPCK